MDKLNLPHAKLVILFIKLYFASELWKMKYISDSEKLMLKGFFK